MVYCEKSLIIEVSYGFVTTVIDNAPGYWDSSLQLHEEKFNPQGWMVEEVVRLKK